VIRSHAKEQWLLRQVEFGRSERLTVAVLPVWCVDRPNSPRSDAFHERRNRARVGSDDDEYVIYPEHQ
jgi:hypothetical protein